MPVQFQDVDDAATIREEEQEHDEQEIEQIRSVPSLPQQILTPFVAQELITWDDLTGGTRTLRRLVRGPSHRAL